MAPEQEPLSALHWNVPRSELSMAAELEAARHAWEGSRAYGAARPARIAQSSTNEAASPV
jgi:hypothetical protein